MEDGRAHHSQGHPGVDATKCFIFLVGGREAVPGNGSKPKGIPDKTHREHTWTVPKVAEGDDCRNGEWKITMVRGRGMGGYGNLGQVIAATFVLRGTAAGEGWSRGKHSNIQASGDLAISDLRFVSCNW
jgi:hypothetical protein